MNLPHREFLIHRSPTLTGFVALLIGGYACTDCRGREGAEPASSSRAEEPPAEPLRSISARKRATTRGDVTFRKLAPGVWLHTSYQEVEGWGDVPANGLVVVVGRGSLLIDTAWNNTQTQSIVDWAREELGHPLTRGIFTHAHSDKMGGVSILRRHGVETYAASDSNQLAPERGLTPAEHAISFDAQGVSMELSPAIAFDPGPGHTVDNIVVALPEQGILFGGCLIRPPDSDSLGNTADADIGHWDDAVEAVATRFPRLAVVVPSHGPPAGRELLHQTIALARRSETTATQGPRGTQ